MEHGIGLVAWIAIGIAASMVFMILPYRRGVRGIATNLVVGVIGAIVGGFVGRALGGEPPYTLSLFTAAVGALGLPPLYHMAWHSMIGHRGTRRSHA